MADTNQAVEEKNDQSAAEQQDPKTNYIFLSKP